MNIYFVIILYRQNPLIFKKLLTALENKKVILIDNNKNNFGFAAGANLGINKALAQNADWIIILNQDIQSSKKAVNDFISQLPKYQTGLVGPFAGGLDPKRWTTILPCQATIDYLSGSFLAIHKKVIQNIGFFYEPYFMYYEDVDFCVRAKKAGFPLSAFSSSGIKHEESVTLSKNSFLHQYYLARNHLLFVERQAPVNVKIHELWRLPKTLWQHYQLKEIGALVGIKDYLSRRFGQYKSRYGHK